MIKMSRSFALWSKISNVLVFAAILQGCATVVPSFDVPYSSDGTPSTRSITNKIRCELFELVRDDLTEEDKYKYRDLIVRSDYESAMLLSLDVTDTGNLEPSLNFPSGTFAFNVGLKFNQSREDNLSISLRYSMRELAYIWAHLDNSQREKILNDCSAVDTNLSGNLGLKSRITAAIETSNRKLIREATPTSGEFSGTINFNVIKSIENVGPTWTLVRFKGPGNLATLTESNNDKLTFGFAEGPGAGSKFDPNKTPYSATRRSKSFGPSRAKEALDRQLNVDTTVQLTNIRANLNRNPF